MLRMLRGWSVVTAVLAVLVTGVPVLASGGQVKLKTDNGPDGYYYNALGNAAGRYCAFYNAGEFDINAVICGVRYAELDQSVVTAGVDGYTMGLDLRSEDPNAATYADLTGGGLIIAGDVNSVPSCSTTGAFRTGTYGGGAGVADPLTSFLITMAQPANNDPAEGIDFCGILLDTNSVFANSARSQGYAPGGATTSIGFNHFVEAVVFEPKEFDLNIRMTGSSRFAGDRGLPVAFARQECAVSSDCVSCLARMVPTTTNSFITSRLSVDNNTLAAPRPLNLIIEADRSVINPKLGPKDVTNLFKPVGGGLALMNPLTFPNGRTVFTLNIKVCIASKFLPLFPVDLPFDIRLQDPNDPNIVPDSESGPMGLRPIAGYYDNDSHAGGFFFTQSPVLTGDALGVRFDAVDLPPVNSTLDVTGVQIVAGEFGASGLAGLDALELRREDAVVARNPDLSPQGLFRAVGTVGDPGNADGIATGLPVTTVLVDFTNYVATPTNPALAINLFALAFLNPGDTGASVTAVGSAGAAGTFIGNSSTLLARTLPVTRFQQDDLEIRLDVGGYLGTSASPERRSGTAEGASLRELGRYVEVQKRP